MKFVYLIRLECGSNGTFGAFVVNGRYICLSLELEWNENIENYSSIPVGTYLCKRLVDWFNYERYGYTFEVTDVPSREGILFHPANWIDDLEGCIAPGTFKTKIKGKIGVAASAKAFLKLKRAIGDVDKFNLIIMALKTSAENDINENEKLGRHGESR